MPLNEADTCRLYVTPKLRQAGWEQRPHSITEQKTFTDGRVEVRGDTVRRRERKRADYLLRYTRDFPLAVVEAKPESDPPGKGLQQAKDYAEILGLKGLNHNRDLLGHFTVKMTEKYAHLHPENVRAAVSCLDGTESRSSHVADLVGFLEKRNSV